MDRYQDMIMDDSQRVTIWFVVIAHYFSRDGGRTLLRRAKERVGGYHAI